MKSFNTNTDNNETWLTPPEIIRALGHFDLDPCCPPNMPWKTADKMLTKEEDGLRSPWTGRVWLNPPYGRQTFIWLSKLANHSRTETGGGIALIFARTETLGFHSEVWDKAQCVFFFKRRLSFYTADGKRGGTANAPSCLVAYTPQDESAIRNAFLQDSLQGKLIHI